MAIITAKQQKVLSITPKPFALLSMVGATFVFWDVLKDRHKRKSVYHHIMLALSTFDFISALCYFVGSWANPSGTSWYGSSGTAASCATFAFLRVFSAAPMAMYNATLSVYYLLLIRFQFSEFGMRKVEPILLFVPFLWGLGTSIATMVQGLYGPDIYVTGVCTLGPPPGCTGSDCQLQQVDAIRFSLVTAVYIISFGVAILSMAMVYGTVANQEQPHNTSSMDGASTAPTPGVLWFTQREHGQDDTAQTRARRMAKQAFWYLLSFFFTYIFSVTWRIVNLSGGTSPYWLVLLCLVFQPLQGFWTCLIYNRPRYLRNREKYPDMTMWQAFVAADDLDHRLGARMMRSEVGPPRTSLFRSLMTGVSFAFGRKSESFNDSSDQNEQVAKSETDMETKGVDA